MDIDAFVAAHSAEWTRLGELSARRRLDAAEADELVGLYRRVSTQLSLVRSRQPDPVLVARLSRLLARARSTVTGTPPVRGWAALARGVTVDFPVAVYRTWRWWTGMAAANLVLAAAMMLWLRAHPQRLDRLISSSAVRQLVDHDFSDYYSQHPAHDFAAQVWTNNALVTAMALFLGVTVIGPLVLMLANTANLGLVGGAMLAAGKPGVFFGLILPHGMLELTAVFIAGGLGLRLGWSWLAPPVALTRGQSLAAAGRTTAVVALGLVGVLLVSGVIEAFVTPSGLPTWARIGIGAIAELAFLAYVIVLGRRGVDAGADGDVSEAERGATVPTA